MNFSPHQSHPLFDIEAAVVRAGNQPCPVDLTPWQDRLDRISGKTIDNKPRLRIVWGQDFEKASQLIMGRPRLKYYFWRYEEAGAIHDIGVPRFYLEELQPKARLEQSGWNRCRFYVDPDTGEWQDVMGPIPEDGFYTCVFIIALHDHICCNGTGMQGKEQCLGAYRPPSDSDLQRVRRIIWNRDNSTSDERNPSASLIEKWS